MVLKRKIDGLCHFVLLLFFLTALPASEAGWDSFTVEDQFRLSVEGRDLLLARDYEGAEKMLAKLVRERPGELLGYFGFMALYQVRNLDNFDFRFDPDYLAWEGNGRRIALKIVQDPKSSPWDLLVAGGTLGVSGFHRAHHSRWFAALRDGSTGIHALEESLERGGA